MTQDKIKEVKAIYSAKNKIKRFKTSGNNINSVSKPFFSGIMEKLEKPNKN